MPVFGRALAETVKCEDTVLGGDVCTVLPFTAELVDVVHAGRAAVPLGPLLDAATRELLDNPDLYILRPQAMWTPTMRLGRKSTPILCY